MRFLHVIVKVVLPREIAGSGEVGRVAGAVDVTSEAQP